MGSHKCCTVHNRKAIAATGCDKPPDLTIAEREVAANLYRDGKHALREEHHEVYLTYYGLSRGGSVSHPPSCYHCIGKIMGKTFARVRHLLAEARRLMKQHIRACRHCGQALVDNDTGQNEDGRAS